MKHRFLQAALAIVLAAVQLPVHAEDIDLFAGATPTSDLPNVLFVVDNTANWNTAFTNEMLALANTFRDLPENKFRIGIMLATETGSPNNNVSGGYMRAAIRTMDNANKMKYRTLIQNLDQNNDKGNGGRTNLTFAEVYYYFTGGRPYAGNNKIKTDFRGNTCTGCNLTATQKAASNAVYAITGSPTANDRNALASFAATTYNSPLIPGGCAKNFVIYISNGPNQGNNSDNTEANRQLAAVGGDTTVMPLSPSGSQEDPTDEWVRFLKTSSLKVKTYTIDVNPPSTGQGPGWTAMLQNMANVSGGKYFSVSSASGAGEEIAKAIAAALSEIQSVNSVFASVSLPVSVNTQGQFLNQVYVGLFRPDPGSLPRWNGNLKQYKLKLFGTDLRLVDADDKRAINTSTGFITECARSFWTPTMIDTYWRFNPQGACIPLSPLAPDAYAISNYPDGNVVEKGGQGFTLRNKAVSARVLKTCSTTIGSCQGAGGLTDFNTANSNITATSLGPTVLPAERDALVNWMRGNDNRDENTNTNLTEMRPSSHGDVVHSRPVALNFGTDTSPQVGVFYGANDGVLRAINGNRTAAIGTAPAGDEMWAFVPPEFYGSIKRLRDNDAITGRISYPGGPAGGTPKSYGPDGSVTAFFDGTTRWLYSTMRRGGRVLYSFNVDPSNPAAVTLKWKRGCPNLADDAACMTGFTGIGQTWSSPVTLKAPGEMSGNRPLALLSGGYDACEDADPHTCTSSTKGNHMYVLDADTGALLNTLNTDRAIIADAVILPDASGLASYAYVADLGGNIYRINIGTAAASAWTITKIASLGCGTVTTCAPNRKFMFTIDLVKDGDDIVLLLGSGDREKPLLFYSAASSVSNHFFMIRDRPQDTGWLSSESSNCGGASVICMSSLLRIDRNSDTAPTAAELTAKKGWYLTLVPSEQVVTSSITIFGTVSFSTQQPQVPTACDTGLGTTRLYNISYKNAAPPDGETSRFAILPEVGLPPSPVGGIVILDDGTKVAFCIGCDKDSPLEAKQPTLPVSVTQTEPKARVFWYIEQ